MSVVIERGLARCPRCVAVADYTFVESGPNSVRYEVHCRKCGETFCEVNPPVAPHFTAATSAASTAVALRAPDLGPATDRRRSRLSALGRARYRAAALAAAAVATVGHRDWRRWLHRRPNAPSAPASQP